MPSKRKTEPPPPPEPAPASPAAADTSAGGARGQDGDRIIVHHTQLEFDGPLPPPAMIEGYDAVYPGAAKLLFEHFAKEQLHRHELEKADFETRAHLAMTEQRMEGRQALTGMYMALTVALTMIVGAAVVVCFGYPQTGGFFLGSSLVPLVASFLAKVNGAKQSNSKRQDK